MNETILKAMPKELLERMWLTFDWTAAEEYVLSLQKELAKAVYVGNDTARVELQKRIVRSTEAKMLAVRKVCNDEGSRGIDGVKWETPADKYYAAMTLTSKNYVATPYRHIIIETKSGRQRHVNVATYYDKAMQILYGYSLNPVAEALGERKSFAFRAGRSMMDANEYIKDALGAIGGDGYVILADVKACYQTISHDWLLKNIPMDTRVLKEFLKAGYVFNGELYAMEDEGISIGFSISPVIANMTLDGMQKYIYEKLYGEGEIEYPDGNLVRFADDTFITVRSRERAEQVINLLSDFLFVRGLKLSYEKTRVVSTQEGFDFLSRHYSIKGGIVYVCPSEKAIARFEDDLEELILNYRGSQKTLIDKINRKLVGWATYHRVSEAGMAFRKIDVFVKATLMKLCQTLHPSWSTSKIIERYWYRDYDGDYVYAMKDRADLRLRKLSDTLLMEHRKVKTNANAYLDSDYIEHRTDAREIASVTGKYRAIWNRQGGRCYYCGHHILGDQSKTVVQRDLGGTRGWTNLAYIHTKCRSQPVELVKTDTEPVSRKDVIELVQSLDERRTKRGSKFQPLGNFFQKKTESSITLTFKEIEEIIGEPLCQTAYKTKQYWFRTDDFGISQSWHMNGYTLARLHLEECRIVFHKTEKAMVPVTIPQVFLNGRVPNDARFELENFFDYIRNKYGL